MEKDEMIRSMQALIDEKQKLLNEALNDLASDCECKYCANVGACSSHCIERNMAYGKCAKWQWRGAKTEGIAS